MSDPQVNQFNRIISSNLSAVQKIGSTVLIETPKNILLFFFNVPKTILVGCAKFVYSPFTRLSSLLGPERRIADPIPPNVASLLTGIDQPTDEQLIQKVKDVQQTALNIIKNQTGARTRLEQYHKELLQWSYDTEKRITNVFTLNDSDKELMKNLALSVRQLKVLKAKKTKLSTSLNDRVSRLANNDIITNEDRKVIKENYKNIVAINSEMEDKKTNCMNLVKESHNLSQIFTKVLHSDSFYDNNQTVLEPNMPMSVIDKMNAVLSKSRLENASIKSCLVGTNEKLDEVLNVTENIKTMLNDLKQQCTDIPKLTDELTLLRSKLDEERTILKTVQNERDDIKEKLDVLEDLIADQEVYLNSRHKQEAFADAICATKLLGTAGIDAVTN